MHEFISVHIMNAEPAYMYTQDCSRTCPFVYGHADMLQCGTVVLSAIIACFESALFRCYFKPRAANVDRVKVHA